MKIATYNVGLLDAWMFGKKIFEFAPHTRERASNIPRFLAETNFDFLFIQELYRKEDLAAVLKLTAKVFPYQLSSRTGRSQFMLGHGLAILSKHPITPMADKRFDKQLVDEAIAGPKGFLAAGTDFPGIGQVLLVNMHTTAGGLFNHPESAKSDVCRGMQLHEAMMYASKFAYAVVGGDLNCGPDVSLSNFASILSQGYERPESHTNATDLPTWDPQNPLNTNSPHRTSPPQRIDHLLFSHPLSAKVRFREVTRIFDTRVAVGHHCCTLSDHYGLCVDFDRR